MLEVAQGIQYIHSEGMVHGNLSGKNIVLDPGFHCQITGFSLTQHVEASVPQVLAVPVNYAAPELLEICNICWQIQCGLKCSGAQPMKQRKKTTESDVYAFGCLYYNAFFAIMPFEGRSTVQIHLLVAAGQYPSRLGNPKMDDVIWNLIERCWLRNPAERPTMDQIVEMLTPSN
ncbi:kinase-like domain-containing protein [Amanita rubescens]|nr:kinase-like domain-containing protein [Amanita rubescens]